MRGSGREFVVGIVFFLLLGALGAITLVLGADVLQSTEAIEFRFDDAAGLTEGADVWINGLPSGTVRSISIDGEGVVTAAARMRNPLGSMRFPHGAKVEITPKSALGGSVIAVTGFKSEEHARKEARKDGRPHPGDAATILAYRWTARPGGLDALSDSLEKLSSEGGLGRALIGEKGVADFTEAIAALKETVASVREWTKEVDAGGNVLSVLLKDKDTAQRLKEIVANVEDLTKRARSPDGLLGRLLDHPETSARFDRILGNLEEISAKANSKDGTIGKLLTDDSLYVKATAVVDDIGEFAKGLRDENGLLHRVLHDPKLAEDLTATLEKASAALDGIQSLVADVRAGKGTIGKLVADEALYNDVRDAVRSVQRSFEEARENAPILTFAGFLFRTF